MIKKDLAKRWFITLLIIGVCTFSAPRSEAGTISDNFDGPVINKQMWGDDYFHTDQNQRCLQQGGIMKIQIDGVSQGPSFGAGLSSNFALKGDFEIVVYYDLTNWPYSNGVGSGIIYMNQDLSRNGHMTRRSFGADEPPTAKECYVSDFIDGTFLDHVESSTSDKQGKMRLTRVGNVMTGYFWQNNGWVKLGSHDYTVTGLDNWLVIGLNSNSSTATRTPQGQLVHPFAGKDVEITYDNLQISYDRIQFFSYRGPAPGSLLLLLE